MAEGSTIVPVDMKCILCLLHQPLKADAHVKLEIEVLEIFTFKGSKAVWQYRSFFVTPLISYLKRIAKATRFSWT